MIKVEVELRLLAPSRYWLRVEVMACLNLLKTTTASQGRIFLLPTMSKPWQLFPCSKE